MLVWMHVQTLNNYLIRVKIEMNNYSWSQLLCLLVTALTSSVAAAYPIYSTVTFSCPCSQTLTANKGGGVEGIGKELIFDQYNPITFTSSAFQSSTPVVSINYSNNAINYDSVLGRVSCDYESLVPTEQPFSLYYHMTNGQGGEIQAKSNSSMIITLPLGFSGKK